MRILFVASEGLPFSKTGGLADVVEALPKALVAEGHEVAVVLPRYRGTAAAAVVIPSLTIPMGGARLRFPAIANGPARSEEHTSELQSHGLISYAVFCLKKKKITGIFCVIRSRIKLETNT